MTNEERDAQLELTERVGAELVRLGLHEHAACARAHYVRVRDDLPSPVPPDPAWRHTMIVEWARTLRMPPHENDYPVRPRMSGCPACDDSRPFTTGVFPGGSKHQCGCGAVWLELDPGLR